MSRDPHFEPPSSSHAPPPQPPPPPPPISDWGKIKSDQQYLHQQHPLLFPNPGSSLFSPAEVTQRLAAAEAQAGLDRAKIARLTAELQEARSTGQVLHRRAQAAESRLAGLDGRPERQAKALMAAAARLERETSWLRRLFKLEYHHAQPQCIFCRLLVRWRNWRTRRRYRRHRQLPYRDEPT